MSDTSERKPYRPTIAVDFDGVIYHRPKSERGNMDYSADAVPGAINFLVNMSKPFEIVLFSARWAGHDGEISSAAAKNWLIKQLAEYNRQQQRKQRPLLIISEFLETIKLTSTKPIAKVYIDDRAWKFEGTFPTAQQLWDFKTWSE